ncbi:hypothetical protein BDQ17DRAFT_1363327 [Cyathus striatus]|nr:hypothetical protein BDQ17DRAFT_1363327 [Cyathus striatus]
MDPNTLPKFPEDPSSTNLSFTQAYTDVHTITTHPHPYNSFANYVVRAYLLNRVDNDLNSTAVFVHAGEGVSFEGNNILVKVDGTEPDKGGVLFSAHFDSVSTAPGVTDNAIAVASLLALLEYLTTHHVKRTAIFNFNNGEEDGLNGAHAFLEHPWSKITHKFLNLEGAGAGGQPLLFRSTSLSPINNYISQSPHGTVISADAFLRGVVRSRTDFSVFMNGLGNDTKMEGLDIAFYTNRAFYHTTHDSIRGAEDAKGSLWSMLSTVHTTALSMLDDPLEDGEGEVEPVCADGWGEVLGRWFVAFTQASMLQFCFALIGAPGPLIFWAATAQPFSAKTSPARGWISFWASFFLSILAQAALVFVVLKYNPYIVHAHSYTLLTSTMSLAYLTTVSFLRFSSAGTSRRVLWKQMYILTYILNALSAYAVYKIKIGGVFFLVGWHFCVLLGWGVEVVCGGVADAATAAAGGARGDREPNSESPSKKGRKKKKLNVKIDDVPSSAANSWWWMIQAIVSIPFPVILMSQVLILFLASLGQTLTDGSNPIFVYASTALLSTFIILPLQRVQVLPDGGVKAITALTGVPFYLQKLVHELPSTWGRNISCAEDTERTRTWTCSWETDLIPSTMYEDIGDIPLSYNVTSLGQTSARLRVKGCDSRSCKVYFDNRNVTRYDVYEVSSDGPGYTIPDEGINSLRMFSRSWDREFVVDLHWEAKSESAEEGEGGFKGRVACQWSEYQSATRGLMRPNLSGSIPAFEEALEYLPRWGLVTKLTDGLVEVWREFEV